MTLRTAIAPDEVIGLMADYDLIAVPSRWLETGPLVALEAFAAGVPVLGANLGGIAELVRDGVDGVLVAADDPAAWAAAIERLVQDRHVDRRHARSRRATANHECGGGRYGNALRESSCTFVAMISVIIPCYNAERTLAATIMSALEQDARQGSDCRQ